MNRLSRSIREQPRTRPGDPVDGRFRHRALAFVALLTLARVVALLAAETDLYVDEAQYWAWAQDLDWGYFSKPPLIAVVIAATTGLLGDAEWAVRISSPLFHAGTAILLMGVGDRLYGGRVGSWAAILWVTLPAVSLSSTLVSTDAPLLLLWSAGLAFTVRLVDGDDRIAAAGLGAAIAIGLNAKYAMALLPAAILSAFVVTPAFRGRLRSRWLWGALGLGLVGLVPNLVWNVRNDFVTFRHTGANADWGSRLLDPGSVAEFAGAQFGVFGPVLLVVLLLAAAGRIGTGRADADRLLLALSVPILAVFVAQSMLAKANANWAATAYPAATVLVAAVLERGPRLAAWRRVSLWVSAVAVGALLVGPAVAPSLRLPWIGRPFERVLGWTAYAEAVADAAAASGARTVIVGRRADTAELLYHLRDTGLTVAVVPPTDRSPRDHFEFTRPFRTDLPGPGLFVAPPGAVLPAGVSPIGPAVEIPVTRGVAKALAMEARAVRW